MTGITEYLCKQLNLREKQVEAVLELLDEGATIPFIARYRKERTGSLDEEQIRQIELMHKYQLSLQEKKESIAHLIEEKGLLSEAIQKRIDACEKLAELEELYRPYMKKKKTKATAAIEAGLEPAAKQILRQDRQNSVDRVVNYWSKRLTCLKKKSVKELVLFWLSNFQMMKKSVHRF